jgi:hypothetical protein
MREDRKTRFELRALKSDVFRHYSWHDRETRADDGKAFAGRWIDIASAELGLG